MPDAVCTFPISSCSLYPLPPSLHPTSSSPLHPVYRLPGTDKVSWQGVGVLSFTSLSGSRKLCSCHVAETIGQGGEAIGMKKKKCRWETQVLDDQSLLFQIPSSSKQHISSQINIKMSIFLKDLFVTQKAFYCILRLLLWSAQFVARNDGIFTNQFVFRV